MVSIGKAARKTNGKLLQENVYARKNWTQSQTLDSFKLLWGFAAKEKEMKTSKELKSTSDICPLCKIIYIHTFQSVLFHSLCSYGRN
jgi:hypothetical protein